MHPTALLFLTPEQRESLAKVEARESEYRIVMATAKREAREARRLAASHASGSPIQTGRLAFLRRLFEPTPPCPDAMTD